MGYADSVKLSLILMLFSTIIFWVGFASGYLTAKIKVSKKIEG